jgi:hypothetical protein
MPNKRLVAVITALMLTTNLYGVRAEYTIEQLEEVERLILQKDVAALWKYIQANPEIAEGQDPLAQELRGFAIGYEQGLVQSFNAQQTNGGWLSNLFGPSASIY